MAGSRTVPVIVPRYAGLREKAQVWCDPATLPAGQAVWCAAFSATIAQAGGMPMSDVTVSSFPALSSMNAVSYTHLTLPTKA